MKDYITGKEIDVNPEEAYRQEFEHILVDDLEYPKNHMDIEVTLQRGSNRHSERMDIVIYNDTNFNQNNIYAVIEIEHAGVKYDLQALSYATATPAQYVAWFSGFEESSERPRYLYRDIAKDATKFIDIPNFPHFGEKFEEIGRYRKSNLKPAKNLKALFQRIHYYLYGNSEIKREENIAEEFIKLLFCKIMDETLPGEMADFRVTPSELRNNFGKEAAVGRIRGLYKQLQKNPSFADMFTDSDILLDNDSIIYVISQLQGVGLMDPATNTDALGDAYEVFLPSTLKGDSGQFFTPREVVRFAVGLIKPSYKDGDTIFDPACGSGGFLSIALEDIRSQMESAFQGRNFSKDRLTSMVKEYAAGHIFGSDIDPLLYRIAKSYMAIIGDGKSNIVNEDSLKNTEGLPLLPGKASVILTNPPFGTKIDVRNQDVLGRFDLGHILEDDGSVTNEVLDGQDPDKLFLNLDLSYLKTGGKMAIVLPKQILSGSESESIKIRRWLLKNAKILAIVDLPREAFQPYTGTKTSLVFLEKVDHIPDNYKIFMAVSEAVGHDRRGVPLYVKDNSGLPKYDDDGSKIINNDLPDILNEWNSFQKGLPTEGRSFLVEFSDILENKIDRLDAWFYDPTKNQIVKQLEDAALTDKIQEIQKLGDLVMERGIFYPGRHKRNYVEKSSDSVAFYSGTQILQTRPYDLKYQPRDYKPAENHFVKKGWLLITRSGSTGRVIMVGDALDGVMVTEHVIRVVVNSELIDPYYLYAYLSSSLIGKTLLDRGIYASVVDHISPQFVESLPIARLEKDKEAAIATSMKQSLDLQDKAIRAFHKGNSALNEDILGA